MSSQVIEIVSDILQAHQIERFGFTELVRPMTMDFYLSWIADSQHGDMEYLNTHSARKAEPKLILPRAKSAIAIAFQYLPTPYPLEEPKLKAARTALYSRGKDYHQWISQKLKEVCQDLKQKFSQDEFASFVDTGPVLERDLAMRAGLGWVGKNTCLIHPKYGSLFFLSEIYTSLDLTEAPPKRIPNHCGTCTRCIDICPTHALSERSLDARKCISYLTIESKSVASIDLRSKVGDWLFGCDLCQSICPWNVKFYKAELQFENRVADRECLIEDLKFILETSNKKLAATFRETSLSRAAGNKLKRNAMVVIANKKIIELKDLVASYLTNDYFTELCQWTLKELDA